MGVRLDEDEAWDVLTRAHTGIFTTLRADGVPIALPVWFVAADRLIWVRAPGPTKKVTRVRHDPRASFLVESGERWAELLAVHLTGRAELVDDPAAHEWIAGALDEKYAAFRTASTDMPSATQRHYAVEHALIRFTPEGRILSWDNSRLRT